MKRKFISACIMLLAVAALATFTIQAADKDFVHGIVVKLNGTNYYLDGAPDGDNGELDIPGHEWVQVGKKKLIGKHYNTGPFGAAKWWSSNAADGELLYIVEAVIDKWTPLKAVQYYADGFVHYHELVTVADGTKHPNMVVWLKHVGVTKFKLDGGPGAPNPPYEHKVERGVDFLFPPNGMTPYDPNE